MERGGVSGSSLVETIYYIVTKVFSCQKIDLYPYLKHEISCF